ncbi:MAG: hypothetical protein FJ299_07495 [Planctomycetes bacterium]|nr:hypothetical protein [Planctomycetota bacterium]
MRMLLLLLALLPACSPHSGSAPRAQTSLATRTDLPLLGGSHPRIQAELAGRKPIVLMVDTGAELTVLSTACARAHELALEPFQASAGLPSAMAGRPIEHCALVPELALGAARATNLRVALVDFTGLDHLANVDGILGQDLLRTWFAVLDGPGQRLILLPRCTIEEGFGQLFAGRTGALRFDVDWRLGVPLVRLPLGAAGDVEFVIDTGANFLCLPPNAIDALGLQPLRRDRVHTLEGEVEREVYELPRTQAGALTIWGDVQSWDYGVLGWSVLSGFVLAQEGKDGVVLLVDRPSWK